ncbi:restriction endonuclease subunit S [Sharpea porci]|uniref:restriction endonuclease subunit S n=1 Tax=Sharpea porci TaxID=2652286 RepID=UPI002A9091C8|nr:restriction endonuclease subunit S [Sharpea porci]MDY5279535.1 restriction endonuclease subunit S [Sharpea porci]
MSTNKSKKPELRFKGFSDDWEQCKLGEIFEEYSEKNHEELPALTIIQGGGTILREESNRNMQYERSSLSGYKMVKKDDFILHLRSFEGGLEKANTNGIISPAYHTFHGENTDSRFYYSFFRSKYFIDVLLKPHVYGIRDGKSIDVEGMKSILVPVPTYNEQKYIGDFVERTDNLITLHQRKCENLIIIKKSMLDNLFPKNGEKVPRWRFKGFNDDWEQRKFGELYKKSSEKNDGSISMDRNITVATMQFKEDVKVSTEDYLKTYYTFNVGDIAFEGHQSKEYRFGRFVENDIGNGIISHIFAVFRPIVDYDLQFWKYAINNESLMQRVLSRSTKASTMMHDLVTDDFLEQKFLVPSVKEQEQIGMFLSDLDHLITLHQSEVERLKKVKQFFLDKMFI